MKDIGPSDAWLAYNEQAEWAAEFHEAEQDFMGSDMYHEGLWEFTHDENDNENGRTEAEWVKTQDFHDYVVSFMDYQKAKREYRDY